MAGTIQQTTVAPTISDESGCPECGGNVTKHSHETICADCGLVVDEQRLDFGPEWREFEDEDVSKARVGAPRTASRHDKGLSTDIGYRRDGNGNPLSKDTKARFGRLRIHHNRAKTASKRERNQRYVFTEVRRICSALDLGYAIRDRACSILRDAQDASLFRGRSLDALAPAAVYCAARAERRPLTGADFGPVARAERRAVVSRAQVLSRELGLGIPPLTPTDHIPGLVADLDLSHDVERDAMATAQAAQDAGLTNGVSPSAFAATCVYRHATPSVTKVRVADVADTCTQTIRSHEKRLNELD